LGRQTAAAEVRRIRGGTHERNSVVKEALRGMPLAKL
jgi:hypothetical protein